MPARRAKHQRLYADCDSLPRQQTRKLDQPPLLPLEHSPGLPAAWLRESDYVDICAQLCRRRRHNRRDAYIVYHCVDEFSKFTGADTAGIAEKEQKLLDKADIVIVSSEALLQSKSQKNPNTFLVTHGVDYDHFAKACLPETETAKECAGIKGPVIGFFGLIADWVDLEVIRHIAIAKPDWSLLLIGEIQTDVSRLRDLKNVHISGRRDYKSLPTYAKLFDVAILPFVINELTLAANPLKVREYLAAGLPVVATPLPEVQRLGNSQDSPSRQPETSFSAAIEKLAARRAPRFLRLKPPTSMQPESWDAKVRRTQQSRRSDGGPREKRE